MKSKNKRIRLVKRKHIDTIKNREIENDIDFDNAISSIHLLSRDELRSTTKCIIEYIISKCANKDLIEGVLDVAKNHKNIENYFTRKNVFFICRVVSITKFDDIELGNKFRDLENKLTRQIEV